MEVKTKENQRNEIVIDGVPIGYVILNENKHVEFAEMYDSFLHTRYEAELTGKFIEVILDYGWVEGA